MERPPRRMAWRRRPKGPMGRILISPDFALLWLKQSVTALCDALFGATLIIWISTSTHSPFSVALALAALGAPYALSGPFAEAAAERWSRRRTMFVADVVRGTLTFLLCLPLLPVFSPWRALVAICLLCFFIGLMTRFSMAAQRSALTAVVPPSEHARGISRIQGSVAIMTIIGPILGAMLFLMGQTPIPGLFLAGFLLLLSAGGAQAMDHQFTAKVRAMHIRRRQHELGPDGEALPSDEDDAGASDEDEDELWSPNVLSAGIADSTRSIPLVLRQRPFASIASAVALVAFVGGIFNVLEVFFVSGYLGRSGAYVGLVLAASAAGFLLGSAWFRQLDAHLHPPVTFTYALLGLGMSAAAFVAIRSFGMALFWAAAMGVANGLLLLAAQTALVETGERKYLARLFAGYETLTALLSVVGVLLGGLVASSASVSSTLSIASGLLILAGLGTWLSLTGIIARFARRKAAQQPKDEQEDDFEQPEDASEDYEPIEDETDEDEDEAGGFGEAGEEQEQDRRFYRPPSRQFGRLWADQDETDQDDASPEENENRYDEAGDQEDEEPWEPAEPVEEPPAPRRSLRLRPSPWEKPGGIGRNRP
jgi:MFS family permease